RPTITSLGAVLDRIQDDIALSGTIAGVATTMPVLAFATVGACVPALVKRTGLIPGVLLANTLLAAGLIMRAVTGTSVVWLLIWTAVATSGIAIANVLLPSLVSQFFPRSPGPVTGAYTMALQIGSSTGAGLTVPLANTLLAAGLIMRAVTGTSVVWLLIWTAVATSGIAIANVLLPSLVSQFFPRSPGPVTGAYTMALQIGSSIGAGLTVPLAHALGGWQGGLGIWAVLAIIASPPWLALLVRDRNTPTASSDRAHTVASAGDNPAPAPPERLRLW